jgi:FAD/FMN-containing dehydrogenase
LCAQRGLAMVPQGGNTGLCGGAVAQQGAVILSTERLTAIRSLDAVGHSMVVEAGCLLSSVQDAAAAADRLFPLSLAAEGSCRIGGNLSTNAGGINVLRYGNARDLVLGLEVVMADGQVWDGLRALRKNNTGYDLKHLFIGAEGTLGIITAAVLKLFPAPRDIQTAFIALPHVDAAVDVLALARQTSSDAVTACELIPHLGLDFVVQQGLRSPLADAHPWYLLLELTSSRPHGLGSAMEDILGEAFDRGWALDAVLAQSGEQRKSLWRIRETLPEAQKHQGGSIKHDVSVAPQRVPEMIRRCVVAVETAMPGIRPIPFGHVGDGNIHFNLTQPVGMDKDAFLGQWQRMNQLVHDIVMEMQGSISAEHGIGLLKVDELARTKSALELSMMRSVKQALDPRGLMNPGKILSL